MSLLIQMTIILAVALLLVPLTKRCQLPTLLGYVLTGILLGPHVLEVIPSSYQLHQLQHLGILLLMFIIGLELRPQRLGELQQREVALTGYALLTSAGIGIGLSHGLLKLDLISSVCIGVALSLLSVSLLGQQLRGSVSTYASTQRMMKLGWVHALAGMFCLALLPLLVNEYSPQQGLAYVTSFVAALSGLFLLNRYVLRPVFNVLAKTGTHELMLASAVFTASLVFILLDTLGLHQVLAAFLAGLLISDSLFRPQLQQSIEPFKGLIFALFFIGLGLILPLPLFLEQYPFIVLGALTLIAIKTLVYFGWALYFKYSWQDSRRISTHFAQAGEFGFVLLYLTLSLKLSSAEIVEPFLLMLLLVLFIHPLWLGFTRLLGHLWSKLPQKVDRDAEQQTHSTPHPPTPLLILGFGRFGQIVGRIAHLNHVRFHALDNALAAHDVIPTEAGRLFALDATRAEHLKQAGIEAAQVVVVAIDDVEDSMNVVRYIQLNYPQLKLLVRARDRHHAHLLRELNVQHLWRETYGSALELAQVSLTHLGLAPEQAQQQVHAFREHDQALQSAQQQIEYDEMRCYQTHELAIDELAYLFAEDLAWMQAQQSEVQDSTDEPFDTTVSEAK
jgi:glutathione-regulated potassium-efflux system protein KefB